MARLLYFSGEKCNKNSRIKLKCNKIDEEESAKLKVESGK